MRTTSDGAGTKKKKKQRKFINFDPNKIQRLGIIIIIRFGKYFYHVVVRGTTERHYMLCRQPDGNKTNGGSAG